jgi:hypothetical protein
MGEFVTIRSRHWRNLLRRVEILESASGELNSAPGAIRNKVLSQADNHSQSQHHCTPKGSSRCSSDSRHRGGK